MSDPVAKFVLDSKDDIDAYLHDMLQHEEYRSMGEIMARLHHVSEQLRPYFIEQASKALQKV